MRARWPCSPSAVQRLVQATNEPSPARLLPHSPPGRSQVWQKRVLVHRLAQGLQVGGRCQSGEGGARTEDEGAVVDPRSLQDLPAFRGHFGGRTFRERQGVYSAQETIAGPHDFARAADVHSAERVQRADAVESRLPQVGQDRHDISADMAVDEHVGPNRLDLANDLREFSS